MKTKELIPTATHHPKQNSRILVIDDDEGILAAFEAMLTSHDYEVITSSTPDILSTFTHQTLPNLILLDVLLSGADGRDICKKIKQDPHTEHLPIIMISAHPAAKSTVKRVGADDYLSKPFEMEELLSKVKKYLS